MRFNDSIILSLMAHVFMQIFFMQPFACTFTVYTKLFSSDVVAFQVVYSAVSNTHTLTLFLHTLLG